MNKIYSFVTVICIFSFVNLHAQETTVQQNLITSKDENYAKYKNSGPYFNIGNLPLISFNFVYGELFNGTAIGLGISIYGTYFEWLTNWDVNGTGINSPNTGKWTGNDGYGFNVGFCIPIDDVVDIIPTVNYELYKEVAVDGDNWWYVPGYGIHNAYQTTYRDIRWGFGVTALFHWHISKRNDIGDWGIGLTLTTNYWGANLVVFRLPIKCTMQ